MREQGILQAIRKREALQQTGRDRSQPLGYRGQAQLGFSETELLAMPQDTSDMQDIQASDGSMLYMAGFSSVGGPDRIAG